MKVCYGDCSILHETHNVILIMAQTSVIILDRAEMAKRKNEQCPFFRFAKSAVGDIA